MAAGRNRNFDKDIALEKAMFVFWKNGYPGTSLTDLTTAMGVNKSSLYATFVNKEVLFNQAMELYLKKHGMIHFVELSKAELSLNQRIRNYLLSSAEMITNSNLPIGCLVCHSTSEATGSGLPENSSSIINNINKQTLLTLTNFFEKEQQQGNLSIDKSPTVVADYLLTLQFGLAVSARNGNSFDELKNIIDYSLTVFR
ncbi:TetR/AcrR family transcriptional regulator [Agaribacter marinus]|uniref:TetR family transcriptional regulator n=1 Tax=Agaribacter marinus TaxID=1431249 RepID=A0AA37SWV5_9ALTE|nr:TetR/AcrR family transcriptional regulator [Agaribacter marinus]GLR69630.1 TetR family transcriptional regulator [Agaribacter marinus]